MQAGVIFPYIMAGGVGSRLWPRSRTARPKQFLALQSEQSMLQETAQRLEGAGFAPLSVICNQEHRFLAAWQMDEIGAKSRIILEAEGRGTAFTVAVAALDALAQDKDALILMLPCDHAIEDGAAFIGAISEAAPAARFGRLAVLGVTAKTPHTGYGYIETGEAERGVFTVKSFHEKPDRKTAAEFLARGNFFWNAGIFLFPATKILEELNAYAPDVLQAAQESYSRAVQDLDFLRLGPAAFAPKISIDVAVLEKSRAVCAVRLDGGWSDLGSWRAVWEEGEKDAQGNLLQGDVLALESANSLVHACGKQSVAALGIEDLMIIADEDAVLVMPMARAEEVSKIVAELKARGHAKYSDHPQIWRPWGNYRILDRGEGYLIKRLTINPGGAVSLQYHNHRAEHWVVVKGAIAVTHGEAEKNLKVNESLYIPRGEIHRISNNGSGPAEIIEVQTGDILEETDIVRLEDRYKRT